MYDELVKDLRENHDKYFARDMQAADAIVKLQKRVPKRPHGRLIDADALIREHRADNFDFAIYATYLVQNAPTIIPEEEK